jgi:hypothetical protein
MYKNAMKCNKTLIKWCKNKHGESTIIDTFETYHLGASISIMPRKIYDMLGLPPLEKCDFDVPLADVAKKKPLGRINDFLIMVNSNLVPIDFLVMDVECNASCPIILGRPFL